MGFFSWKTCDTQETIWNRYTGLCRPVYLLQPDGQKPISEPKYEGYGVFGGVNAYAWLARNNLHMLPEQARDIWSDSDLEFCGIEISHNRFFTDKETGNRWLIFHLSPLTTWICQQYGFRFFPGRYDEPIRECGGLSANAMIQSGRFTERSIKDLLFSEAGFNPLKFSFDPECAYEDWPASEACPNQGYFWFEEEELAS